MKSFPWAAKIYIWAVILAGIPAFLYAWQFSARLPSWEILLLLCAVTAVATFWKVQLFGGPEENNSKMSLGFVPTFFALLYFGPLTGMIAAVVSCIGPCLYPRRAYYFQILFSASAVALAALAAGVILHHGGLGGGTDVPGRWRSLGDQSSYIFLSVLVYYLINTWAVATAISLSTGKKPLLTWREHFLWTCLGYFAGASCATILFALEVSFLNLCMAAPFLGLTYYSFKTYMDKVHANEQHIKDLERGKEELQQLYMSTVQSLALAIDYKDSYTHEHILRVQRVAVAIAEEMGLSGDALQGIYTGALLHDIGKLGIPEHILAKPGKLTAEEFQKIKNHPVIGSMILEPVNFPWPVMPVVRSHHERWDGRGYPPMVWRGEEIPLGGRVLSVADVYDALTSDRSYREGWTHEKACDYIRENTGTHFDPAVVEAFCAVMERCPWLHNDMALQRTRVSAVPGNEVAEGIKRASFEYISLYEISQTVSVTLNLQETLSLLANKINNIFCSGTCVILLAEGDTLRAQMAVGLNDSYFQRAEARVGEGMTGRVAATGEGTIGEYDRSDLLLASAHTPWVLLQSALIVPLYADNTLLGTVNLYHERANAFDAENLRVLLAVSAQAGRAIENARVFEETRESALTDPLTGLHNARYLALFLEQELHRAGREQRALSVLVMDLDNFKPINDTFGHARGDEVLRDLGGLFASGLRSGDLVARYAGDEFVAVLPGTSKAEAQVVAEKIRAAIAGYDPRISGNDLGGIRVGISIGIASFPDDAPDAATLIACADAAMYRDKSLRKKGKENKNPSDRDQQRSGLQLVA